MVRFLMAAALSLALAAPAFAAADPEHYALTAPALEKFTLVNRELNKLPKPKDDKDDDANNGKSVADIVRTLDTTPGVKPVLARHGMSSETYAVTLLALFHAGFYLMMEPSMDKKKGAELLASYSKETRANIELLRKNPQLLKAMEK